MARNKKYHLRLRDELKSPLYKIQYINRREKKCMIKDFSVIFDANHRLQLPSPGPRLNGRLLSNEELNELLIFQDSNFEYFFF
jgi:hypothetical protein